MNNTVKIISLDNTKSINLKTGDEAKVIAVQEAGSKAMIDNYITTEQQIIAQNQPVVPTPPQVETMETITPVAQEVLSEQPNQTIVGGANFEPAPSEIVDTPLNTDMIQPFKIEENQSPVVPEVTQVKENPVQAVNTISDEELIRQIDALLKQSSIKQEAVREQIKLNVKIGLNTSQILNHLDLTRVETAELASQTIDLAKVNQQVQQRPMQPTENIVQPNQAGPTLYQQAA